MFWSPINIISIHGINRLWHLVNSSHKLIRNWQWIYGLCESMRQCKYNANFHFPKNWYLHWIVMNLRNKNWYFTHEFVLPIGWGHITWELKRIISWIFTLESQKNIFCFQKAHKIVESSWIPSVIPGVIIAINLIGCVHLPIHQLLIILIRDYCFSLVWDEIFIQTEMNWRKLLTL